MHATDRDTNCKHNTNVASYCALCPESCSRISFSKEHAHTCRVVKSNHRPGKRECINRKRQFSVFVRCNRFWRVWLRTCRVTVVSRICARSVGQNGVNRPCDFRLSSLVANHGGSRNKGARPYAGDILPFKCTPRSSTCVFGPELHELWGRNARRR